MSVVRWTRLGLHCPHHPDVTVLELSTFDGDSVLVSGPAIDDELVGGWVPTVQERATIEGRWPLGAPSFSVESPVTQTHLRLRVRCPRPSCSLDVQVRSGEGDQAGRFDWLGRHLRAEWAQGVEQLPSVSTAVLG
ncbi:hypothetical protein FHX74_003207 [Friedmanniella endophytica]|uniref:Uncharacterized protein n=1 Tax=Microlunatus kandeliicorticis TaxID=1759536 RepID=A0A7W3P6Z4_9ACTN|nr:hypothetical protein [Microlunatus kandeliicorticis]MBA8795571.1 hypothetical protein [Microlunatus kandeliicorticis]